MAKARTTIVAECAERVRNAEAEVDAARVELKVALAEDGWRELFSHTPVDGAPMITFERDVVGQLDPLTGLPSGSVEIATFDAFVKGERE